MPDVQSGPARISAIKWAEDEDGLILRLVEFRGQGGECVLRLPSAVKSAAKVNLLERQAEVLAVQEDCIRFPLRPWEIATVKLFDTFVWLGQQSRPSQT